MKETKIKGIICPIVTPMYEDESINFAELRNQVDRLIENGCHGIFACGTNGEGYILSDEEKRKILETVIEQCNGRVPVYAGTGCTSTKETIELSLAAQKMGADVLSIITPGFAAASQEALYWHYREIARRVDLPIILYHIPARTGNVLEAATVASLARIDNIAGIKDSSGSFTNILNYISAAAGENFQVLSGNDQLIIWTLLAGGAGGIAGCANVYPAAMASIYNLFEEGKIKEAKRVNESIQSLRNCFRYGNPNTVVKTAVGLLGYDVGKCRAPFHMIPEEGLQALKKVLDENRGRGLR